MTKNRIWKGRTAPQVPKEPETFKAASTTKASMYDLVIPPRPKER